MTLTKETPFSPLSEWSLFRIVTPLHMVSVVGAEVLQWEAEDGEEEVEEVADAQEQ